MIIAIIFLILILPNNFLFIEISCFYFILFYFVFFVFKIEELVRSIFKPAIKPDLTNARML